MKRMHSTDPILFVAPVVKGLGRGRAIGFPTVNLHHSSVPSTLRHGIYACRARWNRRTHGAAMHFGPRPVFRAGVACELQVIGAVIRRPPKRVTVEIVRRLRNIRDFRSVEALKRQIVRDVARTRELTKEA